MLFKNGLIFIDGVYKKLDVRVIGKLITEIGENLLENNSEEVINLDNKKLLPGFIDVHTHGRVGEDFSTSSVDGIHKMCLDYAKHGVTSILATTMTMEYEFSKQMMIRNRIAIESKYKGARILGINLEGPFLGTDKKGCHDEQYLMPLDKNIFDELDNYAGGHILMVDVDPKKENSLEFIKQYSKTKIVSLAHTSATYELGCLAVKEGANHITHLFNAMNSLHHREPGLIGVVSDCPVYAELICDGIHIHQSVIRLMFKSNPEKIVLISDSLSATGVGNGVYELGGLQVYVKDGKATLENGTIACSTIDIFEAVKNCIKFGIKEEDAIKSATILPAKSVNSSKVGQIKEGLYADLIIVTPEFELEQVYLNGEKL